MASSRTEEINEAERALMGFCLDMKKKYNLTVGEEIMVLSKQILRLTKHLKRRRTPL